MTISEISFAQKKGSTAIAEIYQKIAEQLPDVPPPVIARLAIAVFEQTK